MGVKPEGKFKEELIEELVEKERAISREVEKKKAATKVAAGRIRALEERRDEILDLIEGRENVQPALPLTLAKANGKKAEPPPLTWEKEGANEVARTFAGAYCVELGTGGKYQILHTPPGGKSKPVGEAQTAADARHVASRHYLAHAADGILENSGDGKLTKKGRSKIAKKGGARSLPF